MPYSNCRLKGANRTVTRRAPHIQVDLLREYIKMVNSIQEKKLWLLKKEVIVNNPRNPQQQINIEVGEKEAEGIYANIAMIMHSPTEIIMDFARVMPRSPKSRVLARIIMTPMHAKLMMQALTDNIKKYENQFGEIKVHGSADKMGKVIGFESTDTTRSGDDSK